MPFVEVIVDLRRGRQVLEVGAGVALVIAVLTGLLRLNGQGHGEG